MEHYGISRDGDIPNAPKHGRARLSPWRIGGQIIVGSLAGWAVTAILMLIFWLVRTSSATDALGYAALVTGIISLLFGGFSLVGGGIAAEAFTLTWAGVPVYARGKDSEPGGGLTPLGLGIIVSAELFVTAFLLLG